MKVVVAHNRYRTGQPSGENVDVLNGIAHIPGTNEFLVTGKNWPTIFRVRFNGMGQD